MSADGRIHSITWDTNGGWGNWVDVPGATAALGYPVHAAVDEAGHIHLTVAGGSQGVPHHTNRRDPASVWRGWVSH